MATKSLLLSCLLMRFGAAQHPASEAAQTPIAPFPTAASSAAGFASSAAGFATSGAAGSATSTTPSSGPGHEATDLPLALQGVEECDPWGTLRVLEADGAAGTFCACSYYNPYWLKHSSAGMFQRCEEATMMGFVMGLMAKFDEECPYRDFGHFICTSFEVQLRACISRPQVPECQHLSQILRWFGSPYWDDSRPNDKSSSSISHGDQSETLHRRQDLWAVTSKLTDQDTLGRRDADEPYHPVLKSVYEDCDALEDREVQLECVIKEIQRAVCEQNPWIIGCEDVRSDGDDEVPFNPAASDNKEDSSHSQNQATAASQKVTTESLVDWDDLTPRTKDILLECWQAADSDALKRCMDKVIEICFKNPADELCQIFLERS